MCMDIKDAQVSDCRDACNEGCRQLQGRGVVQANGWPIPKKQRIEMGKRKIGICWLIVACLAKKEQLPNFVSES
ncbi:hypothetical protein COLO4_35811 [Corchorus olitorius]|uniref:Uncharacterized protein n=1 Tax=Corchorus olitorius TaxID=93759 RepID=A0A1R3GD99_9ROSI|nr:hypothetical protein COLO4_35811 [Corchorus olitorius]